jgi:hypothetical protein
MTGPLDGIPLWLFFVGSVAVILTAIEAGGWLGRYRRRCADDEREALVGSIAAATLTLLGLLLAFTFGLAASRFDARRQMVVQEANAVGTTYLRAGLLPGDRTVAIRDLLASYADSRLEVTETRDVETALRRAEEIHRALWAEAEALGRQHAESIVVGLFVQALNETIDVHASRVLVGIQGRIPLVLWGALFLMAALTMAGVGYFGGLTRSRRSPAVIVLALTFSGILLLIADLDRPSAGLLEVSQQAMKDVRQMMEETRPTPSTTKTHP